MVFIFFITYNYITSFMISALLRISICFGEWRQNFWKKVLKLKCYWFSVTGVRIGFEGSICPWVNIIKIASFSSFSRLFFYVYLMTTFIIKPSIIIFVAIIALSIQFYLQKKWNFIYSILIVLKVCQRNQKWYLHQGFPNVWWIYPFIFIIFAIKWDFSFWTCPKISNHYLDYLSYYY